MRLSEAWTYFGEANGAATLDEMRARIAHYRRTPISAAEDPEIGCIFVRDVRFFPPDEVFPAPPEFSSNIVQGKRYELAEPSVEPYFADLFNLMLGGAIELDLSRPWHRDGPVFGDPRLSPYRLGQRSFQAVVLTA